MPIAVFPWLSLLDGAQTPRMRIIRDVDQVPAHFRLAIVSRATAAVLT